MEREVAVIGRAEIDTRAPFRSVKEAVVLFGERVLAGEIYANKLKQLQTRESTEHGSQSQSQFGAVSAELEETKQSLQKAKEEGHLMAYCLKSLKQELDHTKRELKQLKDTREFHKQLPSFDAPEIEELSFIENCRDKVEVITPTQREEYYLEKKRSVKFASPHSLTKVITSKDVGDQVLEVNPNSSKKRSSKWKTVIPFIGGLFLKKEGGQQGESSSAQGF